MRCGTLALAIATISGTAAFAQGVKDPPNYAMTPTRPAFTTPQPSRPTAVYNVPTGSLPSGTAVQRTYRDGKLQSNIR